MLAIIFYTLLFMFDLRANFSFLSQLQLQQTSAFCPNYNYSKLQLSVPITTTANFSFLFQLKLQQTSAFCPNYNYSKLQLSVPITTVI